MKTVSKVHFQCDKCGKEFGYDPQSVTYHDYILQQKCWTIDLGKAGYGSSLDGCDIKFDLCDDCLYEFVSTFRHVDRIFGSE